MWCRFSFFAVFCLVAANVVSARDDHDRNEGSQVGGSSFGREGHSDSVSLSQDERGSHRGSSSNGQQQFGTNEGTSFGQNQKNTGNRPNYGAEHSGGRPTEQSSNREDHYSGGFTSNNENHSSRPLGGSSRPTDRPFGSSTNNREGNNRPGNEGFTNRPQGGSFGQFNENRPNEHISGGSSGSPLTFQEGSRPSGLRPDNTGGHSTNRPLGGSNVNYNQNEGHRPTGQQFGRPTGESTHGHQGLRPEGQGSQSGHSSTGSNQHRPAGLNPNNEFGQQFGRPTGESTHNQQSGSHPGQGSQPGHSEQTGTSNKETDDGKEDEEDVCFPNLGCFKMGKPWKSILRPIGAPHSPDKIQTTIHFYSRENLEKQKNITVYPTVNMGEARFDPKKITAIIVHGFSNSGNATWMKDMKNVYLKQVDANVMIVDWGKGAQLLNYFQVAGNTRVVGKSLGLFVKYLIENYGADPGKFHLIGHSLGAQICSYLGKEVPGIARLTALDPAQPGFEGFDAELRLDKNDAEFVDVIHTDARPFIPTLGFGMITPHGHVDFYMNGGYDQPGCVPPSKDELPSVKNILDLGKYPVEVIAKAVACPHARAYEYLIEAFNETEKCIFWGHKADAKNVFKSVTNTLTQGLLKRLTALSTTCSKENCIPVGFATKKSPLRGVFVVTTAARSPYCISEPGIPPESPPEERTQAPTQESFIQKIGKKTGLSG